ncbi:hypothetical protein SDC9_49200 [bioreactor metagenome]|uniref:Peptidase M6-like domain-containing protein n=1 Tax=bioreactor metagenome TaxID=1076179 RepID=A0A644WHK2_9ZZZZ
MKQFLFVLLVLAISATLQAKASNGYKEGDTLNFWTPSYIDWPSLQHVPQRNLTAVCKKAGDHCYVFVEKGIPQPAQSEINKVVSDFDTHFYDSLTFRYGPVPDAFDHDSRIFILVMKEPSWGGYYDPGQQMSDSLINALWNKRSNEREVIYVSESSFSGVTEIVAHEFGHLLHWQQDHSPEPADNPVRYWEEAWVDEGFSTFAAIYLTENIFEKDVADSRTFFVSNPDIPLIYFSNYNQVKLFMLYMFEHFGGWDYITHLIRNQADGIAGVESTLKQLGYSESFDDAFEQWIIANYVDNPSFGNGKYAYRHYNFQPCKVSAAYTTLPKQKAEAKVRPYAADYITFTAGKKSKPFSIRFEGQKDSRFRTAFILMNSKDNSIADIVTVKPDAQNTALFKADGFGKQYDRVVMAVMCVDASVSEKGLVSYSYITEK